MAFMAFMARRCAMRTGVFFFFNTNHLHTLCACVCVLRAAPRSGGSCDCGVEECIRVEGFCSKHRQTKAPSATLDLPNDPRMTQFCLLIHECLLILDTALVRKAGPRTLRTVGTILQWMRAVCEINPLLRRAICVQMLFLSQSEPNRVCVRVRVCVVPCWLACWLCDVVFCGWGCLQTTPHGIVKHYTSDTVHPRAVDTVHPRALPLTPCLGRHPVSSV